MPYKTILFCFVLFCFVLFSGMHAFPGLAAISGTPADVSARISATPSCHQRFPCPASLPHDVSAVPDHRPCPASPPRDASAFFHRPALLASSPSANKYYTKSITKYICFLIMR